MKKKGVLLAVYFAGVFLLHSSALANDAFFTYPGTRAMSMSGAFIAQADDSSAIWYNPAGLKQPGVIFDFTVEAGNVPSLSDNNSYKTDHTQLKFVSLGYNSTKSLWSFGASYFTPYNFSVYIPEKLFSSDTYPIGRVDAPYKQYSLAAARKFSDNFFIGATADFLESLIEANNLDIKYSEYYSSRISGLGGSVGALYKIFHSDALDLKVGAIYRTEARLTGKSQDCSSSDPNSCVSNKHGVGDSIISKYLPSRPESRAIGVNAGFNISVLRFGLNAGYEQTLWSKAFSSNKVDASGLDYSKTMLGGEVIVPISSSMIVFRAGQSESTPDDSKKYSTIKSSSYGLGLSISQNVVIDLATEDRAFSGDSKKYSFWSASASCQY